MKGLVYIFTGEGKGKTSAALGVTLRMLLYGKKVAWISWYKSSRWRMSEMALEKVFPRQIKMYWAGEGFFIEMPSEIVGGVKRANIKGGKVIDDRTRAEHVSAAENALEKARDFLKNNEIELLVLDEVVQAVNDKLISEDEIIDIIKKRGQVHVILTGRGADSRLSASADLVTEMKKIKHPYDVGHLAVKGLDY